MQLEIGSIVEGKITGITKFGAFVDLGGGKVGLVHISEISNVFVKEVKDHVKEGETVKVKIIGINENGKTELSIKQAQPPAPVPPSPGRVTAQPAFRNDFSRKPSAPVGNKFEDMMSKFKKLSDDKLSDFKKKSEPRRGKTGHKNTSGQK